MTNEFQNNLVNELPNITKIEFTKIDKSYFKVILINFFLTFLICLVALILMQSYVLSEEIKPYILYLYISLISVFLIVFVYTKLSFVQKKYALREKDISYKEGLIVKKLTTVPFSRIQHVETDEKPFSRLFGLSALSVYTAGDSSDDLVIKGIKKETALQIKEFISTKINE